MASKPQRRKLLGIDVPPLDLPPGIAALFVIRFDTRTGYVVSWKRSLPGVQVDGAVEYKSLPSGLHNVAEDLVYFVHEQYAGVSAFMNKPAGETERNAIMFSVGVLVPLSAGRLGKSWRHARRLKELAQQYAQDMSDTQLLLDYWETYQIRGPEPLGVPDSPLDSPLSVSKPPPGERSYSSQGRVFSDAMVLESSRPALAPFHPASSLADFVDCFGPLVFPLYRAALLRSRVLLLTEAPVHTPCHYVYDLSLLASVPNSLVPLLPSEDLPALRPRPLFNIGVHDIPYLSSFAGTSRRSGQDRSWIACTTDSVLSMKSNLYDVLVTLPPPYSKNAAEKVYPKISILHKPHVHLKRSATHATHLKATQRDVRRYITLRRGLHQFSRNEGTPSSRPDNDAESTFSSTSIVEPLSWTRRAYTSFIWWASAGEKRDGLSEEEEEEQEEQDTRLLASAENFPGYPFAYSEPPEVALVAYFRRLTTQIFVTLSKAIARHDGDNGTNGDNNNEDGPDDNENDNDNETFMQTARHSAQDQDDDPTAPLIYRGNASTRTPPHNNNNNTNATKRHRKQHHKCDHHDAVKITPADMADMGLDIWSETDRIFVQELVFLWWGRKAHVSGARIRCCGIPIL